MDEKIIAVFGAMVIVPSLIAYTIIQLRKFSNQERMKMLESGVDPALFNVKGVTGKFNTLRIALLLIGVGMGIFLGNLLDYAFNMHEVGYFSMLFLCGGAGLAVAYIIENKKESL
ncbi:MAG: hypothetical protein OEW75_11950 [Cyclobacteriaceae bacterium]|nr:hypothetical protein [Cyclobacteriaceae bacterium]